MYLKLYLKIIEDAKLNPPVKSKLGSIEKHHPLPKSFKKIKEKHEITLQLMSLFNQKEIVMLQTRDHFRVHELLANMFPSGTNEKRAMETALWFMCISKKSLIDMTPESYENIRIAHAENMHNKKDSEETHMKKCRAQKEVHNRPDIKKRHIENLTGVKHSDERRKIEKEAANRPDVIERKIHAQKIINSTPETKARRSAAGKEIQNRPEVKRAKSKIVKQYTKDNVYIATYESLTIAAKSTNTCYSTLCNMLKGRCKTAGGFIWKYAIML